jgi:hypothetical protein
MRLIDMLQVVAALLLTGPLGVHQDHAAIEHRGAGVMGFDQVRTTHHFSLFKDG